MNTRLGGLLVTSSLVWSVPAAHAGWQFNGAPTSLSVYDQVGPALVSNGGGSVTSAWFDMGNGSPTIRGRGITHYGDSMWDGSTGIVAPVANIDIAPWTLPDGAGGMIGVWNDYRNGNWDIYAQHFDGNGNNLWGNGVALCLAVGDQTHPTLVTDGAGGAIVAWTDGRSPTAGDIYVRRIDASGNPQWAADGVALCTATGGQGSPRMIPDGFGGAVLVWGDFRAGDWDVYARRVDATGNPVWANDGIPIASTSQMEYDYHIKGDGAGGALISWMTPNTTMDPARGTVHVTRIDILGNPHWPAPATLCDLEGDRVPTDMFPDGAAGAIVAWHDYRSGSNADIYVSRVNSLGDTPWTPNGVAVCTAPGNQLDPVLASDGAGGVIVAWTDNRGGATADIYAARIDPTGTPMWIPNGIPVSSAASHQGNPRIVFDDAGGVVLAWEDSRNGNTAIFVQRLDAQYGEWGHPEPKLISVADVPADNGGFVTLEWTASQRDVLGDDLITDYTIWRSLDAPGATWDQVGTVPATHQVSYTFAAPTFFDSSSPFYHRYQVFAHSNQTGGADKNWPSEILAGYSINNLPTGIGETPFLTRLMLHPNVPNPFSDATTFHVGLPMPADARLEVYDVAGRRVATRISSMSAGWQSMSFDGRDDAGRSLASGVYFYRVTALGSTVTKKMVIAR